MDILAGISPRMGRTAMSRTAMSINFQDRRDDYVTTLERKSESGDHSEAAYSSKDQLHEVIWQIIK